MRREGVNYDLSRRGKFGFRGNLHRTQTALTMDNPILGVYRKTNIIKSIKRGEIKVFLVDMTVWVLCKSENVIRIVHEVVFVLCCVA